MRVVVIGASADRGKYGNKAVRAYLSQGHEVFAVNPHAATIEGVATFASIMDVPGPIDRATVYLRPEAGLAAMRALAQRGDVGEVWLNPGADDPGVVALAAELGLNVVQACSIVDIGVLPHRLG